jgi:membrane-bound lytic murein transglycosylase D
MIYRLLIILALLTNTLFAFLTFDDNYQKDIAVVKSFDLEPYFVNDKVLLKVQQQYKREHSTKRFFKAMDDAYVFLPTVKKMITDAGIPPAFLYLAMAESNFSARAYSNKRASGLWQFMPGTAKRYGLKINSYVDERRDLLKSTEAAIKYLTHLHERFGKWYMAALAYNCGEARLIEGITRASIDRYCELYGGCEKNKKIQHYRNVIKKYQKKRVGFSSLNRVYKEVQKFNIELASEELLYVQKRVKRQYVPSESRRYIRKIVALSLMGNDANFLMDSEFAYLLNRGNAYSLASVEVAAGEELEYIANTLQMQKNELEKYNHHLRYGFTPPYGKKYHVYIPYLKLVDFKTNYKPSNKKRKTYVHRVRSGETLWSIARLYGIPYKVIKDYNGLRKNSLQIRQKLIIPSKFGNKRISKATASSKKYRVRKGDTLSSISRKFRIKISHLKRLNQLKNSNIQIGDRLIVN